MNSFCAVIVLVFAIGVNAVIDDNGKYDHRYKSSQYIGINDGKYYPMNDGAYVHVDDMRELGRYIHIPYPYDGGYGPYLHEPNPYVHEEPPHVDKPYKRIDEYHRVDKDGRVDPDGRVDGDEVDYSGAGTGIRSIEIPRPQVPLVYGFPEHNPQPQQQLPSVLQYQYVVPEYQEHYHQKHHYQSTPFHVASTPYQEYHSRRRRSLLDLARANA